MRESSENAPAGDVTKFIQPVAPFIECALRRDVDFIETWLSARQYCSFSLLAQRKGTQKKGHPTSIGLAARSFSL
jgi:hypothetical protein